MRPLISGIMPLKDYANAHKIVGIERAELIIDLVRRPRSFKGKICYYITALRPGKKRLEFYPMPDWEWVHTHQFGAFYHFPEVKINIDCAISGGCVKILYNGSLLQADWITNPIAAKRGDVLQPEYGVHIDA